MDSSAAAITRCAERLAAVLSSAVALAGTLTACGVPPPEPADLVIKNARVYTMDPSRPRAEALAIRGDRILAVGSEAEIERRLSPGTRVLDGHGRTVLPGFIDSHNHISFGSDPEVLDLAGARTLAELAGRVRAFASSHPGLDWIEGEGWNYSALPGGRLPTARDLEGVTGGRPAFLVSYDAHTVWLNREAILKIGIGPRTTSLPFGEIDRDPGGKPTGLLRSFATLGLSQEGQAALRRVVPSYSTERRYERLKRNLATAAGFGITTVVDPQVFLEDLPLYARARDEGILQPRLQLALFHPRGMPDADLVKFDEARRAYDDDRLRVAAVKLYIDDVVEPHTAAMLAPYSDRPDLRGDTLYPPEEFKDVVAALDRLKFQMFIHAIGDRGIRVALDALQAARERNGPRDSRHQLVHIECLSPADVGRFKELGVVACMQPRHCAPDISGKWAVNIGPERSRLAWAFRSLRDAGAVLAFASDWNVAEMDPLVGIDTALTRRALDGTPAGGWIPGQTIDLETALRAYTIQGAYANFVDTVRGSIVPGKEADLVMLSDDLFDLQPDRIRKARVVLTLVGGREVYRSPEPA
jgi:predicted amidohydrolase YtcJ